MTTDRYAVAGHPVTHSRSPWIHARFAALTGQDIDYGRLPCPLDGFAAAVRAFAADGVGQPGAPRARGCNVTVPFKFEAPALCAGLTPRAALAQAVNTLRFDPEGWQGDNTDGAGLVADITVHAGVPLAGATLLLVGAGGAAAGVLGPLIEAGVARLGSASEQAIAKVGDDYARRHAFNTAIAALMELMNAIGKFNDTSEQGRAVRHEAFEAIVLLLNPITPHISHELWHRLGHADPVIDAGWPVLDESALVQDSLQLVIQVNGKLRGHLEMPASASREEVEAAARANENVLRFVDGLTIRKVIVVPGKLVNIVAS